ncbi:MAG: hypothetical protein IIB83_01395 [Bacteroidetes bacterium]|nr:hypothetical protein [Bacteroidota bacterium]
MKDHINRNITDIKKLLLELKEKNFVLVIRKGKKGEIFSRRLKWKLTNKVYEQFGCFVCNPVPYPTLLVGLRAHGIGLVGSVYPVEYIHCALPNKLFEYMSQGVVPVVMNCREAENFVTKHDCGIVIKDINDLSVLKLDVLRQKRENVLKLRRKLTMESQLHIIEGLYEEVLDAKGS